MTPNELRSIQAARNTLAQYYISDPKDLDLKDILGCEKILYKESKLNSCQGNLIRFNNRGIINISSSITHSYKKRFVLAHELGHWFMHRDKVLFTCTNENMNDWTLNNPIIEIEANAFAGELILPENILKLYFKTPVPDVAIFREISHTYQISLSALSIKYAKSGIWPVCIFFCTNNAIDWPLPSRRFPYKVFGNKHIPNNSLTEECLRKQVKEASTRVIETKKWFPNDYSVKDDSYLNEMVFPMPNLNACLTFVWEYQIV